MGMASGERVGSVTCILAQMWENGAPKAPENFFGLPKGEIFFLPMCLYSKCSDFCGEVKHGRKTRKKFRPPDPTSKSALGSWPIPLLLVTGHLGVWGGWGGGCAMLYTVVHQDR